MSRLKQDGTAKPISRNQLLRRERGQGNIHYLCSADHVCVCVCVFSSHSFWTSSSLDVPAGVTQEEGHTGFLIHLLSAVRALIFLARRIQPFLSLVDREVEFCVLTIQSFSTRWAFLFLFFCFLVRKIPFAGIVLTSQRVRGLRGTSELPGRPARVGLAILPG